MEKGLKGMKSIVVNRSLFMSIHMHAMCTLMYKIGSPLKAELEKHKPQCMESLASALEKAVTSPKRKKVL